MIAEAVKEQEEKDGNFQTTSVGKPVGLDGGRRLAVLAGSLQKVYRFLHPERHFRQGFARLTQDDYETIIHNAADVERSVFSLSVFRIAVSGPDRLCQFAFRRGHNHVRRARERLCVAEQGIIALF